MADLQSSVSRGVFSYKGKKSSATIDSYIGKDAGIKDRHYLCDDLWEQIDEKIQVLHAELNSKIFEDLVEYTKQAHSDVSSGNKYKRLEIPTAALVTGVNMPDHAGMFSNLVSLLKERVTSHVAVLKSKDCLNLKVTMSTMISQLIDNTFMVEDEEDDIVDTGVNIRRVSCTMETVKSWYREATKKVSSPRKRKLSSSPQKSPRKGRTSSKSEPEPIIIILEDFEGFPERILQDFLTICSIHICDLPLVMIFGIATSLTAVHRLLPHKVSSLLCMEKFQAPPSSEYLNHVLSEVIMTPRVPFKLNGKSFRLLLDLFLYHDFSVLNFTRGFQYSMLDHYFSVPASLLCQPLPDVEALLPKLSHEQMEQIRSLQSYRRFVERRPPQEQIDLLEDDAYTKEIFYKCMATLDHYHSCFFPVMRCLHIFVKKLPRYPLGKQLREVYSIAIMTNVCDTPEYAEAINLIRAMSRDEILNLIEQSVEPMSEVGQPEELTSIKDSLLEFHRKLSDVDSIVMQEDEEQEENKGDLPKRLNMATLKQKLQEMEQKKKRLSPYEALRTETVDFLDSTFRKYLKNPREFPLHEIQYYSNTNKLREHVNGSPRATIQRGLTNPYFYLDNEVLKVDSGTISPVLPDLSIVYKLHLECGKMINLYDWLQAFITILHSEEDADTIGDQRKPDKVLQARFIRAVSELQFLGFIKPTKRKTDHVARLTWGGC